jgi:hypothetical protein
MYCLIIVPQSPLYAASTADDQIWRWDSAAHERVRQWTQLYCNNQYASMMATAALSATNVINGNHGSSHATKQLMMAPPTRERWMAFHPRLRAAVRTFLHGTYKRSPTSLSLACQSTSASTTTATPTRATSSSAASCEAHQICSLPRLPRVLVMAIIQYVLPVFNIPPIYAMRAPPYAFESCRSPTSA